jgi:hypothetical protein
MVSVTHYRTASPGRQARHASRLRPVSLHLQELRLLIETIVPGNINVKS